MSYHTITWKIDPGYGVKGEFSCTAPDTEPCRRTCSEGYCEYAPCEHDVVAPEGECLFVQWFEYTGDNPAEAYAGEPTAPKDGPVKPEWEGDYYSWTYSTCDRCTGPLLGKESSPCGVCRLVELEEESEPEVEYYLSPDRKWRWRVRASNGQVVSASHQGFWSKWNAKRNYRRVSR